MIKDVIFFNNFGLYSLCQLEAAKRGLKLAQFQAECVAEHCAKQKDPQVFKNNQQLFIVCQKYAAKEGASVAEFIERCCAERMGFKKGSILDLNRDA
jgi:hypothetical protein